MCTSQNSFRPVRFAHFCTHLLTKILTSEVNKQVLLVSTYVVCERLSVMHEPAGVVEILVQIQGEYPLF